MTNIEFFLTVDGCGPFSFSEWKKVNTEDPDVFHVHPDDVLLVKNLKPGESCFVGIVEVKRMPEKELTPYEAWQKERHGDIINQDIDQLDFENDDNLLRTMEFDSFETAMLVRMEDHC